jgi:hypothetical protein
MLALCVRPYQADLAQREPRERAQARRRACGRFDAGNQRLGTQRLVQRERAHASCASRCYGEVGDTSALVFDKVEAFVGNFWAQKSGEQIISTVAEALHAQGIRAVYGDQREAFMISAAFARHGIDFREMTWTAPSKERAVGTVRRWLADGMLYLPEHERLRDELLEFEERTTAAGGFTFAARGSGHDDFVALLLTAAMADHDGWLRGSPVRHPTLLDALKNASARDMGRMQTALLGRKGSFLPFFK